MKKRGHYAKSKAREAIKAFIVEIYKKGITSNLQNLKNECNHDDYVKYIELINAYNNDETERKKKTFQVRDPGSQKDYSYFYTEGTRHLGKKERLSKEERQKNQISHLSRQTKKVTQQLEGKKGELDGLNKACAEAQKVYNDIVKEAGCCVEFQAKMIEAFTKVNYFDIKARRKYACNQLLLTIANFLDDKFKKAAEGKETIPIKLFGEIGELFKSFKDFDAGDRSDVLIPKDVLVAIKNDGNAAFQFNGMDFDKCAAELKEAEKQQ